MEFGLDDELLSLQQTARRFAEEEVIPVAAELDVSGEFPREILRKAWELGLSSTFIPAEYGGVGLSVLGDCIAVEEISRGCSGVTTSIISNDLGLTPILVGGSEEQKREWLTPCAEEFKILAFCLSEPGAGSDVASLALHAEKDGEDY
ncbi:MAG TPA: acyl-CoA dehydrogenase family protein, partial [Myxococcota bacterium]|nr:acyl-CoA dehydrogenase family protein [Myxococcota bacterium]